MKNIQLPKPLCFQPHGTFANEVASWFIDVKIAVWSFGVLVSAPRSNERNPCTEENTSKVDNDQHAPAEWNQEQPTKGVRPEPEADGNRVVPTPVTLT